MQPRYLLHPGWITSPHDGDHHYIGVADLVQLYGLERSDYAVANPPFTDYLADNPNVAHLWPRADGNYSL